MVSAEAKTKIWTVTGTASDTDGMKTYAQYCPIARGAEVFAERWTPVIVRNLLLGCETFTQIQRGAPGIPRSLLAARLALLERIGIVERTPNETGRGSRYLLTEAGRELGPVCMALGEWGARWLELAPEHLDPGVTLWSLCHHLEPGKIPTRRVVVGFEFAGAPVREQRLWLLVEHMRAEVCATPPGEEDLRVHADAAAFVRWYLGQLSWSSALASGSIRIDGPRALARSFPTWTTRSAFAHVTPGRR